VALRPVWDPDRNRHHGFLFSDGRKKLIAYRKPAGEAMSVRFPVLVELSVGGFYDGVGPGAKGIKPA
jgi:hypothetical protein